MNITLIGFGNMGQIVKEVAEERGHKIVSIIDKNNEKADYKIIEKNSLQNTDLVIDFSHPSSVLENINNVLSQKINIIVGTTGWYDHIKEVEESVKKADIGFLWSANFSIGVNLYLKIIERAAELINSCEEYDVWGNEIHHRFKADSPSGTTKLIEKIILDKIKRKKAVVEDKLDRRILPEEFHFSSTRGGNINFSHTVGFDSAADTITIMHSARNRSGYALGAVLAAEWLNKKKGFFGMEDFLKSQLIF